MHAARSHQVLHVPDKMMIDWRLRNCDCVFGLLWSFDTFFIFDFIIVIFLCFLIGCDNN